MPPEKAHRIAYQFAPIYCQKVHQKNPRGDFITRIGELALQPALIVYDYFTGLREFSLQYTRNLYLGIG